MFWLFCFIVCLVSIPVYLFFRKFIEKEYSEKFNEYGSELEQYKKNTESDMRAYRHTEEPKKPSKPWITIIPSWPIVTVLSILAIFAMLATSTVKPDGDQIGLIDRVYLASSLKPGTKIAVNGERGYQSEIIMPGWAFRPFIHVWNNVDYVPYVTVPQGYYGLIEAVDGLELKPGQIMADTWPEGSLMGHLDKEGNRTGSMLDAEYFLKNGGQKGLQASVLTPGSYPINLYLFNVKIVTATDVITYDQDGRHERPRTVSDHMTKRHDVEPGTVGVVKSSIDEGSRPAFITKSGEIVKCHSGSEKVVEAGELRAVMVPVGCKGVWEEALPPGGYFLNYHAYEIVDMDVRVQTWVYAGGYSRRVIKLNIQENGSVKQEEGDPKPIDVPEGAAGPSIETKVEGWPVHVDLRLQVQVSPELAPAVVASVGDAEKIRENIMTPNVRSIVRNVGGARIKVRNILAYEEALADRKLLETRIELLKNPDAEVKMPDKLREVEIERLEMKFKLAEFNLPNPDEEIIREVRVLDFMQNRDALQTAFTDRIVQEGKNAFIDVVGVKLANADIPPEMLLARKRQQIADQQKKALAQEQLAQTQRIATERATQTAAKQATLVDQEIATQASELYETEQDNRGTADGNYLKQKAEGQAAQAKVLGEDRVMQLQIEQMNIDKDIRIAKMVIEAVKEKPEILTELNLPASVVFGSGGFNLEALGSMVSNSKLFGGPVENSNKKN